MRRLLNFPSQPSIQVFLMYPPNFPRAPPYFRVVNPNPNQFHPKYAYIKLQSLNDPKSVILNSILNEIKSWNPSKSVVNLNIKR